MTPGTALNTLEAAPGPLRTVSGDAEELFTGGTTGRVPDSRKQLR